jgi:hypothetical protein
VIGSHSLTLKEGGKEERHVVLSPANFEKKSCKVASGFPSRPRLINNTEVIIFILRYILYTLYYQLIIQIKKIKKSNGQT